MHSALPLFLWILLATLGISQAEQPLPGTPHAEAFLTSTHLVPGEQCQLVVRLQGAEPDSRPIAPTIANTAVNFIRSSSFIDHQGSIKTSFIYRLSSARQGEYTVPPITLFSGGISYTSPAIPFRVHSLETLTPIPTGINKNPILSAWFSHKNKLFTGERCPLILKLYIPTQLPVAEQGWGLPEPAKNNCLAWRFTPPPINDSSHVTIKGVSYQSAVYSTTLSGMSPGPATLGPAPLRLIVRQSVIDPIKGPLLVNRPIELNIPGTRFTILPLPAGAPEGYQGAVGSFTISAHAEPLILAEEEPTEVTLRIVGRGNLENIQPPRFINKAWKTIDSSKITRGEERRDIEGHLIYRQLLRPQRLAGNSLPTHIPAYTLSYFDPDQQTYHKLSTHPIPVQIKTSQNTAVLDHGTPETLGTPAESMRNILGFIDRPSLTPISAKHSRYWHLVPLALSLLIISRPIARKIQMRRQQHPYRARQEIDLNRLKKARDTLDFYRQSGQFIERWLPQNSKSNNPDDELGAILKQRDTLCFNPDNKSPASINKLEKQRIIQLLSKSVKHSLSMILLALVLSSPTSHATNPAQPDITHAQSAWKSGEYSKALALYRELFPDPSTTPPDILFNIGNCHHRLNQPGPAALAWRQTLAIQLNHQQARQNLSFVEFQQKASVPHYQDWQFKLMLATPSDYQMLSHAALWIFLLTGLTLWLIRPRRRIGSVLVCLLVISPVITLLAQLARHYYPDPSTFAAMDQQAVVIESSPIFRNAHRSDDPMLQLPAASLLRIDAQRGPWTRVTTIDGDSGWIPSRRLNPLSKPYPAP